jgi:hypothetical protein
MADTLIVKVNGGTDEEWVGSWSEFQEANQDGGMSKEELAHILNTITQGEKYFGGGGASSDWTLEVQPHEHDYAFSRGCGATVCLECQDHQGLARCFCGWSQSGADGYRELIEMGEQIESDY